MKNVDQIEMTWTHQQIIRLYLHIYITQGNEQCSNDAIVRHMKAGTLVSFFAAMHYDYISKHMLVI